MGKAGSESEDDDESETEAEVTEQLWFFPNIFFF